MSSIYEGDDQQFSALTDDGRFDLCRVKIGPLRESTRMTTELFQSEHHALWGEYSKDGGEIRTGIWVGLCQDLVAELGEIPWWASEGATEELKENRKMV